MPRYAWSSSCHWAFGAAVRGRVYINVTHLGAVQYDEEAYTIRGGRAGSGKAP